MIYYILSIAIFLAVFLAKGITIKNKFLILVLCGLAFFVYVIATFDSAYSENKMRERILFSRDVIGEDKTIVNEKGPIMFYYDSITLDNRKIALIKDDKGNNSIYYADSLYLFPYHFIVDKDTIDVSDMKIDRVVGENGLEVSVYQGNSGHYQYDFILKERLYLTKIFILDKEEKLDSILIDRFLPINDREQRKIDSFINGDLDF